MHEPGAHDALLQAGNEGPRGRKRACSGALGLLPIAAAMIFGVAVGLAVSRGTPPLPPRLASPVGSQSALPFGTPGDVMSHTPDLRPYPTPGQHHTNKPPKDPECNWTGNALLKDARKARPMGPHSVWHCNPGEGPPLHSSTRKPIRDDVFQRFTREFDTLFNATAGLETGGNPAFECTADCADGPFTEHWGGAFVSVDGQMHSRGYAGHVSLMSQSKVAAYILAIQAVGIARVQQYVSAEPSGRGFGDLSTLSDHRAFNPYVSTGAELVWSLLEGATPGGYKEAVELNREFWQRISVGAEDDEVRLKLDTGEAPAAEAIRQLPEDPRELMGKGKSTSSTNLATIYVMAARLAQMGGLPPNSTIEGTFQGFVQVNNLRLTPRMMATASATLANGGVNPLTGERCLTERQVRYVLSQMMMAGLYDGSGRWAFAIGMPAKSGVAGGLMVVAPGVGGFATVSEPLNEQGNSARGIAFFEGLIHRFPHLHSYTPGAGSDPNLSLTPQEECHLKATTVELRPGVYVPA